MSYSDYSYLDLTVMALLRKRVLSQDATVLFSQTLDRVLWANAFGAQLFSGSGIADLLDARLSPTHPLIRQITNALRQEDEEEPLIRRLRVSHGLNSELVRSEIRNAVLPNGEPVVLLVCPHDTADKRLREYQLATKAVEALEDFAAASAVLDEFGLIVAASEGFEDLDIDPSVLEELVREADDEADRLVKRPIPTGDGTRLPAGLGKIRDHPSRFLVVLADADAADTGAYTIHEYMEYVPPFTEDQVDEDDIAAPPFADPDDVALPPWLADDETRDEADSGPEESESPERAIADDADDVLPAANGKTAAEEIEEPSLDTPRQSDSVGDPPSISIMPERAAGRSLLDRWYFDSPAREKARKDDDRTEDRTEDRTPAGEAELSAEAVNTEDVGRKTAEFDSAAETDAVPKADDDTGPAPRKPLTPTDDVERFAFTIDRSQIVRSVSDGLSRVVGSQSADIVDRHWSDVARTRGFDENGAILKLLSRADTWSGRTVLWPIEGTDMSVPVDLAALPAYDRDRNFDGFRGFGVIRTADTVVDPEAIGLRIAQGVELSEDEAIAGSPADDWNGDDDDGHTIAWNTDLDLEDRVTSPERERETSPDETPFREDAGQSDKEANVYRLADRRARYSDSDGLTGNERRNFSEIRRSLRKDEEAERESYLKADHAGTGTGEAFEANGRIGEKADAEPDSGSDTVQDKDDEPEGLAPTVADEGAEDRFSGPALVLKAGRTLFANRALLELTGHDSPQSLEAAGGLEALLMPSREHGLHGESDTDGLETSAVGGTESLPDRSMHVRRRDGSSIPVRCRLQRVNWNGESALAVSFSEPSASLAKEKIALDMVRASELENILDTAADGIMIIARDGSIVSLNPSGEALFGRDHNTVSGKHFTELFSLDSREALRAYADTMASSASPSSGDRVSKIFQQGCEAIGLEANGGMIPLFVTLGRVGSDGHLCAVLRDLTEWKRAEQELVSARKDAETASQQKSRFLSRVSHEIREPLTAIIGFSDIMLEERFGPVGSDRYREYLKDINRSGIHVLDLVNDLLDISKIEAGKLELNFEAVDLNRVIAETVSLLQPQANTRRIIVRTSLSSAVPKVVADTRSMRQIFLNLLGNAINHSPENTQVIISSTLEENGEVSLRVRDNGEGMSKAEMDKVLNEADPLAAPSGRDNAPSARTIGDGNTAAARKPTSRTGIGLPLTKALVEANRAYFDLESTVGEGTVVHIVFPSQRVLAD